MRLPSVANAIRVRACATVLVLGTLVGGLVDARLISRVLLAAPEERPLPDAQAFLREARKRLQTDSALQSSYVYFETRREQKLDKRGRVTEESVKVFESYPGLPGEP